MLEVHPPHRPTHTWTPGLAPCEVARQNAAVALLPGDESRMYNRMSLQREIYLAGAGRRA